MGLRTAIRMDMLRSEYFRHCDSKCKPILDYSAIIISFGSHQSARLIVIERYLK